MLSKGGMCGGEGTHQGGISDATGERQLFDSPASIHIEIETGRLCTGGKSMDIMI